MKLTQNEQFEILAKHLEVDPFSIDICNYPSYGGFAPLNAAGGDYLVLTDQQADKAVKAYCKENVWAFSSNFLACVTGLDETVFTSLQPQCENANEAILALVKSTCGVKKLVSEAILWEGSRGPLLAQYDGTEEEIRTETGEWVYIYRIN